MQIAFPGRNCVYVLIALLLALALAACVPAAAIAQPYSAAETTVQEPVIAKPNITFIKCTSTKIKCTSNNVENKNVPVKVKLSLNKVAGASKYVVYRSLTKNGAYKKVATAKKASCTMKKLMAGKAYYFKVKAYKGKKLLSTSSIKKVVPFKYSKRLKHLPLWMIYSYGCCDGTVWPSLDNAGAHECELARADGKSHWSHAYCANLTPYTVIP